MRIMIRSENIMGTVPIKKLLPTMAMPIMFSMLVQSLYFIVDGIYVAQISNDALTAVNLTMPISNFIIAVAAGTAVGMNALLSRKLGEKKYDDANKVANNGIMLAFVSSVLFALFGIFGSTWFMQVCTDDAEIIQSGALYMRICNVLSMGIFMQIMFERILQVTGKTVYQMSAQLVGAITNIVLDPIFIFGYFGMPEMGLAGAAVATVIGQWLGMTICIVLNAKFNKEVKVDFKLMKPHFASIKSIYKVGFPSIVMQSIGSIMVFGMNQILIRFTSVAVAVFGVYFKLLSFVFMPVFGLTSSLIPIVGYNFGARKKERIMETIKLSCITAVIIMLVGTIAFWVFPTQLLLMFNADTQMLEIGITALRILSLGFVTAGICIVFSSVFQAMGRGTLSMWMSISRQLVVLLPCALALSYFFGLEAVWYAFTISECVALAMGIVFFRSLYKNVISHIPDEDAQEAPQA